MDQEEREQVEALAQLIIKHKGACTAIIDNDNWQIVQDVPPGWDEWEDDRQDEWYENEGVIARSSDYPSLEVSYGYGILEALAFVVGLKLEGV